MERSETEPELSSSHTTANPAGLAHDAGHTAKTRPVDQRALKNLTPPV